MTYSWMFRLLVVLMSVLVSVVKPDSELCSNLPAVHLGPELCPALSNNSFADHFYPSSLACYLHGTDDASSRPFSLSPSLTYYGNKCDNFAVHINGIVELRDGGLNRFQNSSFPIENQIFIAPFYADIDTRTAGIVFYDVINDPNSEALKKAEDQVITFTEYSNFSPEYLIVATWICVDYFGQQMNDDKLTFQCVIATDGNMSFAIFLYDELQWSNVEGSGPARIGFNDGMSLKSWEMPCSGGATITAVTNTSNVGVPGIWVFRIDREEIEPVCTNKEQCEGDALCSCLTDDDPQKMCKCQCEEGSGDTCTKDQELVCMEITTPATSLSMPIPTSKSEDPEGSQNRNPSSIPIALIAGVSGGGLLVVIILVILFGVMIKCCLARNSQPIGPSGQKNAEEAEGGINGSPITTTSGGACTQDSEAQEMGETEKIILLSDGDDNITTTKFQGPGKRGSKTQSSNAKKPPTHPVSRGSRNGTTSPTEPTHSQSRSAQNKPSTTGQSAKQAPGQSKQPARTGSVSKASPTRTAPPPPSNGNQRPSSRRQEPREGPVRSPQRTNASTNKKAKAKPKPTTNTNIGNFMYP